VVLVVLSVVEQRRAAVLEVLRGGVPVTEVARRYEVTPQTVHRRLRLYAAEVFGGVWGIGRRSRCRVCIRWTRWSRLGLWSSAARTRGGADLDQSPGSVSRGWIRCRAGRSTGASFVTG
jgi:hypothetical protein